jgi:hypothetical protein
LLVTLAVTPIVVGALALSIVALLSLQAGAANRISDAADAQTASSNFEKDVQSASDLTTSSSVTQCGSGTQLLGMEWSPNQQGSFQVVVSYVEIPTGHAYSLVRNYCASGASTTPTSTSYLSYDVAAAQPAPTITTTPEDVNKVALATTTWVSTIGITSVVLAITEPSSKFAYTLYSLPRGGTSTNPLPAVSSASTSCGFATPGTGTYASQLCFVNFASYNYQSTSGVCQTITAAITGTPYTLSFCLKTSATPSNYTGNLCNNPSLAKIAATVVPCSFPTYVDAPNSEAFLGNNGFYTGVPGDPALYENAEGTTASVDLTNIKVLDSNGNPATGWNLVTGDAESTDAGESITWTSDQLLSILPNSPTSPYGNACANPTPENGATAANGLTGVGTTQVECKESVQSDKNGTLMLEAPGPTTLTADLVGTGLQAIFIGVLLP